MHFACQFHQPCGKRKRQFLHRKGDTSQVNRWPLQVYSITMSYIHEKKIQPNWQAKEMPNKEGIFFCTHQLTDNRGTVTLGNVEK